MRRALVPLAALLFAAAACSRPPEKVEEKRPTHRVAPRDITEAAVEDGLLKPYRSISIVPEAKREKLLGVYVREGDAVRAGDVLFRFDDSQLTEQAKILASRAEAARLKLAVLREQRSGSTLAEAESSLARAQGELDEIRRSLAVSEQMAGLGLGAAQELETLRGRARSAELAVAAARQRLEELKARETTPEMAELEAELLRTESEKKEVERLKAATVGTAPFDGRVVWIDDQVKNLAGPTEKLDLSLPLGRGPLLTIAQVDRLRVEGRFFERDVARIRVGQKAVVSASHAPGRTFAGEVTTIGEFGSVRGQSSTVAVEVIVDNRDRALKPGLTAQVRVIIAERTGVPAVPVEYVRRSPAGAQEVTRLLADGRREVVPVTTGVSDGEWLEVTGGVQAGDLLVQE